MAEWRKCGMDVQRAREADRQVRLIDEGALVDIEAKGDYGRRNIVPHVAIDAP